MTDARHRAPQTSPGTRRAPTVDRANGLASQRPSVTHTLRIGVLASGRGSNLQAILDRCADGQLSAQVVIVGCNRAGSQCVLRAREAGIQVCLADRATIPERTQRQRILFDALQAANVELVVLAGFDEIIVREFIGRYAGKIINVHPSLLPAFRGTMHAVQEALDCGVRLSGCTVHLVSDEPDAGPILYQSCVEVHDTDTVEVLHARIRSQEHELLPIAIQAFAENRIVVDGAHARVIGDDVHRRTRSSARLPVELGDDRQAELVARRAPIIDQTPSSLLDRVGTDQ
jgi:phosphoribosylglycinamide formyltransferase 1